MNIVMFVDKFFPYIGGVEKHTLKICSILQKRGYNITIFTRNAKDMPDEQIYNGIKIIRLNLDGRFVRGKVFYQLLKKLNIIIKSDILHFHDFSTYYYWYLPLRYILFWKQTYVTFHGWEGVIPPQEKIKNIRRKVEKLSDGNICVGSFIEKWYGTRANNIIYGASDYDPSCYDIKKDNEKFLYLGRLEQDTGIYKYIDVLKELKRKYNMNMYLEICGDGSEKDSVIEILEAENIKYIFKGFVNNPEECLNDSKFCFTSGYLSIIEAMCNRNLVICVYDNELKKDYLELMPCSNNMIIGNEIGMLAQEVYDVATDEDKYCKLVNNAGIWANNQTWDNVVNTYLKLWNKNI